MTTPPQLVTWPLEPIVEGSDIYHLLIALGRARYYIKRVYGKSRTRTDGSKCDPSIDVEAVAAEFLVAQYLGISFDPRITLSGDGGRDTVFHLKDEMADAWAAMPRGNYTLDVVWNGYQDKETGSERVGGCLIVNKWETQRHAQFCCLVGGTFGTQMRIMGWCQHEELAVLDDSRLEADRKWNVPWTLLHKEDMRTLVEPGRNP